MDRTIPSLDGMAPSAIAKESNNRREKACPRQTEESRQAAGAGARARGKREARKEVAGGSDRGRSLRLSRGATGAEIGGKEQQERKNLTAWSAMTRGEKERDSKESGKREGREERGERRGGGARGKGTGREGGGEMKDG
eukprot:747026-Hanusia_phi.AAC.1